MKRKYPRTEDDFIIENVSGLLNIVKKHTDAGFDDIPLSIIYRRFYQLIKFLQDNNLTIRILYEDLQEITNESELRNSHLNDKGFYFLQYSLTKWEVRLYKDAGEKKEWQYLEKWFITFQGQS